MRARLAVFVASVASGCVLFPALDDLTGASDAQPDDVSSEAPSDAGADVTTTADADGAVVDADADAGPFCAAHASATFCADFDESADAATGFTSTYLTAGGIVSLDTTAYKTAPASLLAGSGAMDAGTSCHAAEVRSTGKTPASSVTFDMDLRVDKLDSSNSYIESLAIVFNAPVKSSIQLNLKSSSSEVGEEIVGLDGGKTYVPHSLPLLAMSTWMHVTIAVALAPSRTLTVAIDGTTVVNAVSLNAAFSGAGSVDLYLGNAYAPGPSDGAKIHYDDAVLVVQ